jgi:hypothetical protein
MCNQAAKSTQSIPTSVRSKVKSKMSQLAYFPIQLRMRQIPYAIKSTEVNNEYPCKMSKIMLSFPVVDSKIFQREYSNTSN